MESCLFRSKKNSKAAFEIQNQTLFWLIFAGIGIEQHQNTPPHVQRTLSPIPQPGKDGGGVFVSFLDSMFMVFLCNVVPLHVCYYSLAVLHTLCRTSGGGHGPVSPHADEQSCFFTWEVASANHSSSPYVCIWMPKKKQTQLTQIYHIKPMSYIHPGGGWITEMGLCERKMDPKGRKVDFPQYKCTFFSNVTDWFCQGGKWPTHSHGFCSNML